MDSHGALTESQSPERPMAQKEVQLFKWIRQRATPGDVQSVIKVPRSVLWCGQCSCGPCNSCDALGACATVFQVIEEFAEERSWLKIQGEQKKELLEAAGRGSIGPQQTSHLMLFLGGGGGGGVLTRELQVQWRGAVMPNLFFRGDASRGGPHC